VGAGQRHAAHKYFLLYVPNMHLVNGLPTSFGGMRTFASTPVAWSAKTVNMDMNMNLNLNLNPTEERDRDVRDVCDFAFFHKKSKSIIKIKILYKRMTTRMLSQQSNVRMSRSE
jgi:hypothetical protein